MVIGDRDYLEQILINLIDNAIKYGREGGNITVSAIQKNQSEIEVSVRDNGIGIPREDLPRIFERFYRVDKGRSQEMGGTGLGLSIVKHLVQVHGGRTWAESQQGKGSTFYFTLPAYRK
jgi:signal transduction histidine kinase